MASSPYKFLDYYGFDDAAKFFGRETETEILLSDVISTPLVLLFAKTGSGKTSLINAGVRPRLEELNYKTFYIRVEKDPTKSAREVLRQARLLPQRVRRRSLDFQLTDTVRRLKRPIVLFFDQFEEFFLYISAKSPDNARKFISNVAELYGNYDSGVHLVFSFREEFFIDMDAFREEIPTIFHNDSNLRLRWLDKTQARDAIAGPAKRARFKIEDALIERLLVDLSENDRIEPARLQIICDTLWRERSHGQARLIDYEKLGGATRILDWRLGQDINKHLDDEQLQLLRKLVPQLANAERGTKYVRGLSELTESLDTNKEYLHKLIDNLKELHLIRETTRYGETYVEWTSDYLAERTQYLEQRVHATYLCRLLRKGMERKKSQTSSKPESRRSEQNLWALHLFPREFEEISMGVNLLGEPSVEEIQFLFEASLEHGTHMDLWFQKATKSTESRKNAWRTLEDKIINQKVRAEQAENAVRLLGAQRTGRAMRMLKKALQQEALASTTIAVLGEMRTKAAMEIMSNALSREDLADQIISMLSQIRTIESVQVLEQLLGNERLGEDTERALERLSRVGVSKASLLAKKILTGWHRRASAKLSGPAMSSAGSDAAPLSESFTGRSWRVTDWLSLLHRIRDGACTAFVGARLTHDGSSINSVVARSMAKKYGYLGGDTAELSKVAQFLSIRYDYRFAARTIAKALAFRKAVVNPEAEKVYNMLASLPISLYVTTNYDDRLERSLQRCGKSPYRLVHTSSRRLPVRSAHSAGDPKRPIVWHLHGDFSQPDSMVLTEDDHLRFLFDIGKHEYDYVPRYILGEMKMGSKMILGYDQSDLAFRVLLQGLLTPVTDRASSTSCIQLLPTMTEAMPSPKYAEEYFRLISMNIYWGTPQQFASELIDRLQHFGYKNF